MRERFGGRLLFNTLWMAGGLAVRPFVQAAYFIILTRCLGPSDYGLFITCSALLAIASPFCGWGTGTMVVKRLNEAEPRRVGHALGCGIALTLCFGGVILAITASIGAAMATPALPLVAITIFAASDLVLGKLQDLCWQTYQAVERLNRTSQMQLAQVVIRLAAVCLFALFGRHDLSSWAVFYGAAAALSAAAFLLLATRELGMPRMRWTDMRQDLREGFWFATGLSSQNIYNDIDKPLVAALAGPAAAGIYGAAYRMLEVTFLPVRALLYAANPEFFKAGRSDQPSRLALLLLPRVMTVAVLGSAAAFIIPFFIRPLIGDAYATAAEALTILAAIPICRALHNLAGDALTGSSRQPLRTALQAGCAALTVILGIRVIGEYSWRGAAFLSVGMDAALAVAMWTVLRSVEQRPCQTPVIVS